MAQKRIKLARQDGVKDNLRLLYDDGSQGLLCYANRTLHGCPVRPDSVVGLTLKQAKLKLGVK